ncbi:hypothetical protein PF005_g6938 [Phytophthora fragariae]|uniref:Uncharacterized protein n=1 Tax=Phytophthora fragariae TaxID=53985 RepID=A0A6A3FBI6_9STRA|nr:hypothetical protein PF003_g16590 [Phytophthora fragariae]KAE8942523.1 hypothetical protein PF009_g7724 [Phytophthora fragariae]KAE9123139.1 hypothetical protein PF007_g7170 [Phytophthora fragariae]KAE9149452.1 hypothetical protein PF006_g6054 [Phytophthora fragariae]KAE9221880.1 hypothetical protein PF005_g6938 [Phytophthora fragariae]
MVARWRKFAQLFVQIKNLARVQASTRTSLARRSQPENVLLLSKFTSKLVTWDNVVSLQLEHLDGAKRVFVVVRETKLSEGALSDARYCSEASRYVNVIEFVLLASNEDEPGLAQRWSVSPRHWARRTCLLRGRLKWRSTAR